MVPLNIKYQNEKISREKLIEICFKHKKEGKAKIFAFIIYNYRDKELISKMKDIDYMASLDTISSNYLSVFYINQDKNFINLNNVYTSDLRKELEGVEKNIFDSVSESSKILFFNEKLDEIASFLIDNSEELTQEIEFAVKIIKDEKVLNKIEKIENNDLNKIIRIHRKYPQINDILKGITMIYLQKIFT